MPQGSVLRPVLFVVFINDLPQTVLSQVYLFADDTKLFNRRITRDEDNTLLQEDLNSLQQWSKQWLLQFHPDKCKWMCIKRGKDKIQREYHMTRPDGSKHTLERAQTEKDLGINIDESLTFDAHIQEKVNTATRMMEMIRRSFNYLGPKNFMWLFKSLVRPILECAQSVWCPWKKKYINSIENVQRRATNLIPQIKGLTYENILRTLNLPTLKYRRYRGDMIETY